jgi:hypothetical protein
MTVQWKTAWAGCQDGLCAWLLMFRQVQVPGSALDELNALADPMVLEEYRAVKPDLAAQIIRSRDEALAHQRIYNRAIRVCGSIQMAASVFGVWYIASHYWP